MAKLVSSFRILLVSVPLTAVGFLLFFKISHQAIVMWDEASYLERIYWFVRSVQTNDFSMIRMFLTTQPGKPPLQEILFLPILSIFGFSIQLVRGISIILFLVTGFLIYRKANNLSSGKNKHIAGIASIGFFVTSPLFLYLSSTAMRESIGAFWSMLCIALLSDDIQKLRIWKKIMLGFLFFGLSMIKLQYGLVLVGAYAATIGIEAVFVKRNIRFLYPAIIPILPFVMFSILYCCYPLSRLQDIWFTLTDPWHTMVAPPTLYSIGMYYPFALIYTYSISPFVGYVLLGSVLYAVLRIHTQSVRLLFAYVLVQGILGVWHSINMQERYIAVVFPSVVLLAGLGVSTAISDLQKLFKIKIKYVEIGVSIIILTGISLTFIILPERIGAVAAYVSKTPVFMQTDFTDEQWFNYNPSSWPHTIPWGISQKSETLIIKTAQNMDLSKPVIQAGDSNEFSQPYKQLLFELVRNNKTFPSLPHSQYLVIFDIKPTSVFYSLDYQNKNLWKVQQGFSAVQADPDYFLYKEISMDQLGVRSLIYAKK